MQNLLLSICLVLTLSSVSCRRLIELNTDNSPVWTENARTWDHVPLTVDASALHNSAYDSSIESAMKVWNGAVGRPLFRKASPGERVDVRLQGSDGAPCGNIDAHQLDTKVAAGTWLCPNGTAEVQYQELTDIVSAYLVTTHELGHVLGLAHNKAGIMAESLPMNDVTKNGLQAAPLIFPWSKHVRALKDRYPATR